MQGVDKGEVSAAVSPDGLAELIERAQRLDPDAYDALVDAYGQRLFGFLYRMTGRREDAEDLLQEVFLRMVRMLGRYRHQGRFESWLFRIAANLGRDRIRRVGRTPTIISMSEGSGGEGDDQDAGWEPVSPDEGGPDASLLQVERRGRLEEALGQLADAEREVIMLRHFSEMSFAEIAETMQTPLGTALARAHRGLAKLRRIMEGE
ncbi:MAG: RNA polymerase sigma factor [bacterium]|nr:RNA polymerase sigma factor [bacterium]